jgi:hypothetical protein
LKTLTISSSALVATFLPDNFRTNYLSIGFFLTRRTRPPSSHPRLVGVVAWVDDFAIFSYHSESTLSTTPSMTTSLPSQCGALLLFFLPAFADISTQQTSYATAHDACVDSSPKLLLLPAMRGAS